MLELIYELNEKTGDIDLVERTDDNYDTLIAENGDVIADNIHKDIFDEAESLNIQENGLSVNNLTKENLGSLSDFVLKLSVYTQTEIAFGIYGFADQNGNLAGDTLFADVMPYAGNTDRTSTAAPNMDGTILLVQAHTHPSFSGGSPNYSTGIGSDAMNMQVAKPVRSMILGRLGTGIYSYDSKTNEINVHKKTNFKNPIFTKERVKTDLGWKKKF